MIKLGIGVGLFALLMACDTSGVKKEKSNSGTVNPKISKQESTQKSDIPFVVAKEKLAKGGKQITEKTLPGGLKINWFTRGTGETIQAEDVLKINYEVRLEDGTIVDGNQLLNREWLPFMVGFQMQTKGWEMALLELKVGDFVEIFIPAKLARGEKGIKGVIPPNSPNIVRLEIIEKIKPTREIDGTKVWLLEQNVKETKLATLDNTVDFHYMVSTPSNPKYDISYRKEGPFSMQFSDFGIIKGLKKAMVKAKKSDKIWILVPPSEAYGDKGLVDLVKPNEPLFYDIFVMDVR